MQQGVESKKAVAKLIKMGRTMKISLILREEGEEDAARS